ncbi:uncharacterized protein LOC114566045 [Perca flavescens]|uniref:uncharacterized protein LOC114566045 n=1 Tax=Perca flavescens TaxID=8167 RepID=UPI00106E92C8|nr:uncharacterized protein LOC114566045 [Perca flavescens]
MSEERKEVKSNGLEKLPLHANANIKYKEEIGVGYRWGGHTLANQSKAPESRYITASSSEVFSSEGPSVTLSCTYAVKADNLVWYRQDPGSSYEETETQGGAELLLNYRRERNFYIQQTPIHKSATLPLFNMLSLHCMISLLFFSILTGVSCEELTPVEKEENSLEGSSVTLSCRYSKQADNDYFFWYRQYSGKPPEFIIFISEMYFTKQAESLTRFYAKLSEEKHSVDLQISSAAVTDSALYYCAVRPTVTANPQSLYKNTS